jgi:hypothetical protein
MDKETEFRASESAESVSEFADLAMLGSLLFPPFAIFGLGGKLLADANVSSEIDSARRLDETSESEADEIADRWEGSRNSNEDTLRVEFKSSDGGRAIYTYRTEDDSISASEESTCDDDNSEGDSDTSRDDDSSESDFDATRESSESGDEEHSQDEESPSDDDSQSDEHDSDDEE